MGNARTYTDGNIAANNRVMAGWLNPVNTVVFTLLGNGTEYTGNANLPGTLAVAGNVTLAQKLDVTGNTTVGNLSVTGAFSPAGNQSFGNVLVTGQLSVVGNQSIVGEFTQTGNMTLSGTFNAPTIIAPTSITPGTGGAIKGQRLMRATVDQSITTNTTLASATNMSFAIAANEEWIADFDLDLGAALQTTGFKLAVTVPASATLNLIAAYVGNAQAVGTDTTAERTTTGGAALDFVTTETSVNFALVRVSVWVLNSTNAGTVQVQIAQSTSSATALILRKGSHGVANRI